MVHDGRRDKNEHTVRRAGITDLSHSKEAEKGVENRDQGGKVDKKTT